MVKRANRHERAIQNQSRHTKSCHASNGDHVRQYVAPPVTSLTAIPIGILEVRDVATASYARTYLRMIPINLYLLSTPVPDIGFTIPSNVWGNRINTACEGNVGQTLL